MLEYDSLYFRTFKKLESVVKEYKTKKDSLNKTIEFKSKISDIFFPILKILEEGKIENCWSADNKDIYFIYEEGEFLCQNNSHCSYDVFIIHLNKSTPWTIELCSELENFKKDILEGMKIIEIIIRKAEPIMISYMKYLTFLYKSGIYENKEVERTKG